MNILVTGARGMVGTALCRRLKTLRDGKDRTRPALHIDAIDEYTRFSTPAELDEYCVRADFVFHLAGVNRPKDPAEFLRGNCGVTADLLRCLKKHASRAPVLFASSIQATLAGRYGESEYGESKRAGERLMFAYADETGVPVYVCRFPHLMGHSRPNYNSAVSTFCWAVANDQPYTVNDRAAVLELLYIDDLIEGLLDLLEGKVQRCDYDGMTAVPKVDGRFCRIGEPHTVTLGEIIDLLQSFKTQSETLLMPAMPKGSFAKKLHALYLTYLPAEQFRYPLKMHTDARGSFTELLKTVDHGQFSVNISRPGITRGQHWHSSKWEIFLVVHGTARIEERDLATGEKVSFEVSGERLEAVRMIPGWTHSITNLSDTEELVTLLWANEPFDPAHPDTYFEEV